MLSSAGRRNQAAQFRDFTKATDLSRGPSRPPSLPPVATFTGSHSFCWEHHYLIKNDRLLFFSPSFLLPPILQDWMPRRPTKNMRGTFVTALKIKVG